MKTFRVPSNLCHLFLCLAVLFGLAQVEILAASEKSKSGGKDSVRPNKEKQVRLWEQTEAGNLPARGQRLLTPQKYLVFRLNHAALSELLAEMPLEFTDAARARTVIMEVPMPDGKLARFRIEESPMLAPSVAAELPGVKTFSGQGIDDPTATARFDWTLSKGFHGYVLAQTGTVYLDPYQENDRENYLVYYKHEYGAAGRNFHCDLDQNTSLIRADYRPSISPPDFTNGADLRTYRIAIAGTGEYTVFQGGQANALAAVMTAVNRLTGIFRREAAISFMLVSGTNILFPDPATDPYDNSGDGGQLGINQTQLDMIIGAGNYDVGHLFVTSGGGIATTPCVCTGQKAEGLSGLPMPTGDPFVVDFVAHEIGHQFSGQHSYNNSGDGVCTTRSMNNAFEPASGATIMSYVGQCSPRDLASNSLDLFTVQSLAQVINYRNDMGGGGSCGTLTTPGNTPPVLGALANFTIPRNTPFYLTATATDANDPANQLTYSWEENDLGPASGTATTPDSDADGMARPIFRILPPTNTGATRSFPSLTYILNNANVPPVTYTGTSPTGAVCNAGNCITGEVLPSIARVMNFRVTVRDNNAGSGGAADAGMTVTVDGATGPFRVTVPNTNLTWQANSMQTVTWDVNGSNANAANVKISLSTDGGQTFPATILATTPNNGTAQITVPNVTTDQARIKIEGVNNIFFDISDMNFAITGGTGATPTPTSTPTSTPGGTPLPTPTPGGTPTPTPGTTPGSAANISTRLPVGTGDNILITGFIITGPTGSTKRVLVRGIGPSTMVPGALADPTLELRGTGGLLASNDNWRTTVIGGIITADQVAEIQATTAAPTNDAESALIGTLAPGPYTAQIRGANNTTGIGLSEAFDLSLTSAARLANVSTRGFVQTGDNIMIGGFIIVTNPVRVVIRGIGPSLTAAGVPNALADPTIELRGVNGLILANNNWKDTQQAEIMATTLQPTDDLESALVITLQPGSYTAQLRGNNNGTGNGLVEVFALPTLPGTPTPTPAGTPTPTPAGTPTPTTAPKLFIANGNNSTVTTSDLDGTGGTALAIPAGLLNGPQGIAINATAGKIYISNETGNTITQSNLDGAMSMNMTFNPPVMLQGPYGVALDVPGNKIYIANGGNNTIVRADLDGGNAASLGNLNNLLSTPQGMAIDVMNNKMYVANSAGPNKGIIRADLDGMNANVILSFNVAPLNGIPIDVALTADRMYIVDVNGRVFYADLGGLNPVMIDNLGLMQPRGIGLDITGGKMYISSADNNRVVQADLPLGANPMPLTITTLNGPAVVKVYRAP